MKIGIYGGSFNPIHIGHLIIADFIRIKKGFDKILFIPVGSPSHRENNLLNGKERLKMVELAIEDYPYFDSTDIEIDRKEVSYSVDTLMELKEKFPENDYIEIIGEDSAEYLHTWKDLDKILDISGFLVLKRPNSNYNKNYKNVEVIESPLLEISSTKIRERIKIGTGFRYMLDNRVYNYIMENRLYNLGGEIYDCKKK